MGEVTGLRFDVTRNNYILLNILGLIALSMQLTRSLDDPYIS